MAKSLLEKVKAFDKTGTIKTEVDGAVRLLRDFRAKYRFVKNPESIEALNPDDIFKLHPAEVGEFFHWLEYYLKPIGHLTLYSRVYRRIRNQLDDFKELLHVTVDPKKSLAEKVDAPWDRIKGMGYDRHIAKKIIYCFNYEDGDILPIFNTRHLEHFYNEVVDKPSFPAKYVTLGEKYQFLISELLGVKQSLPEAQTWELPYFSRFLYDNYPHLTWTNLYSRQVKKQEQTIRRETNRSNSEHSSSCLMNCKEKESSQQRSTEITGNSGRKDLKIGDY